MNIYEMVNVHIATHDFFQLFVTDEVGYYADTIHSLFAPGPIRSPERIGQ